MKAGMLFFIAGLALIGFLLAGCTQQGQPGTQPPLAPPVEPPALDAEGKLAEQASLPEELQGTEEAGADIEGLNDLPALLNPQ